MSDTNADLRVGTVLVDADEVRVGEVRALGEDELLVHRPVGDDVYIRRSAIAAFGPKRAVLKAPGEQLAALGLLRPADDIQPAAPEPEPDPDQWRRDEPVLSLDPSESPLPPRGWQEQAKVGLRVLTSDGADLGTVKQIEAERFLIDRSLARDMWMPATYVDHVGGDAVILQLTEREVGTMAWEHPPLV